MADAEKAEPVRSKQGRHIKKKAMAVLLLTVLGAGGVAVGYFAANGFQPLNMSGEVEMPKLVAKEGRSIDPVVMTTKPAAIISNEGSKDQIEESAYKATYYPIEDPFTTNLKNSDSFAQISISVATYYDAQVLDNIAEHETAIRSAILMSLADQELVALGTPQGKRTLQKILTDAINGVLKEKTGFGGVDNVYFTSFVVQ
ncbi:flagellar basal body-associated FliL family protein [Parasphingorhabdus sp. JC815]|uniref:flagellar basal body-associated FliL family protein n=1 Tax=Parasphingorhabdus sp. JC815 TaxID=3232140 RepID=UPI0034582DD1